MKNTAVQTKTQYQEYTVHQDPLNTSWNYNTNRSNM